MKNIGDCILFAGHIGRYGYGVIEKQGKKLAAHRVAYERAYGAIPKGMNVCHRCDVRACINPEHLFLGTQADNIADMVAKKRHLTGEKNPAHSLSEVEVRSILRLHAKGWKQLEIAERFGISRPHVSNIVRRTRWAHL